MIAPVEYVGHLEEINELEYEGVQQVVLIGTWVRANYRGNSATVKKDEFGFTMANFKRTLAFGRDSFAHRAAREEGCRSRRRSTERNAFSTRTS